MPEVVAVVPTYRPESERLSALLSRLTSWGLPTVVSDDGSPEPAIGLHADPLVTVVQHTRNRGVARGLNDGLAAAQQAEARWLLTVDQDSELAADYLARLLAQVELAAPLLSRPIGAVGAGQVEDDSGPLRYPVAWAEGVPQTAEVIQTGTLWSVPAMLALGGFDEDFGIDAVDAAACVRLRSTGYAIVLAPAARLSHRIGQARQVRLLGRPVLATNHNPARRETMVRNRLRLAPEEFRESPAQAFRSLRRLTTGTLLALTIEEDRWSKAKATARGIRGAFRRPSDRGDMFGPDLGGGSE